MASKIFTSAVLLAAGSGARLGGDLPKQFRPLKRKPLALYSFELFASLSEVDEIVVVCPPAYRSLFAADKPLVFTEGGARRQDSVYRGLLASSPHADLICIHDSARPFVEAEHCLELLQEAALSKASALAVPAASTIKQVQGCQVLQTLDRSLLWEIQTPQAIDRRLLLQAYEFAHRHNVEATDDLSLVEAMGHPTTVVRGSPRNVKITTPFDWAMAEQCAIN